MSAPPSCAPPSTADSNVFRQALPRFATGVTAAPAALPDRRFAGVTINASHAVSLDPPLAQSAAMFIRTGRRAVTAAGLSQSADFACRHDLHQPHHT